MWGVWAFALLDDSNIVSVGLFQDNIKATSLLVCLTSTDLPVQSRFDYVDLIWKSHEELRDVKLQVVFFGNMLTKQFILNYV